MSETPNQNSPRPIRWWPVLLILAAAIFAHLILRFIPSASQQAFNMHVACIIICAGGLLVLWLLFFSRLQWQTRFSVLGLLVAGCGLLVAVFRFHGVNGNLIPILEPRWKHREFQTPVATATAPALAGKAPGASDFPQFFGPNRDGHLAGPILATNWEIHPPVELWRTQVGPAWSGFAVAGSIAITQEQRGEDECAIAYDLETGKVIWSHADKEHYLNSLAGEGPRATPTIAGQRVFVHGGTGLLNCLNVADGHVLWSQHGTASLPAWGEATSPLVQDGLVIVNAGGLGHTSIVAYNLNDGSIKWSNETQFAGYSSPLAVNFSGTKQVLIFGEALVGCDLRTGKELWQFPWPGGHPHVAMPMLVSENEIVISSGYGTGSARIKIQQDAATGGWSAKQVWRTNRMKAKFANLILQDGYIYGLDDGIMECIDAGTGALAWKDGRYGHGQILLVGSVLLVMAEDGEVILIDPKPGSLHELTRFRALNEKTWNPPALAGEYLIVRNDKEAACFRMPVSLKSNTP